MQTSFKTIGIIGRLKNPGVSDTLRSLVEYLQQLNQNIVIESDTAESLNGHKFPTITRDQIAKHCDILIVVGGDGSLLNAAHAVMDTETPVLGINRGKLGFLTDIHPTELEKIKDILSGQYTIEKRFLLSATTDLHGKVLDKAYALNEVAMLPDSVPHMIEFEIYVDDQFVCSQESDGLIVATPTGSTAYALSGGGPILHPQLDAMVLVPICAHTLTNRPIVIEGNRRITIVVPPTNVSSPRLSCDAQGFFNAPPGSHINIAKHNLALNLIHPLDYDYYKTLRTKLHWGKKLSYTE